MTRLQAKRVLALAVGLGLGAPMGGATMTGCAAAGSSGAVARRARIEASPHWADGRFVNSLHRVEPQLFKTLLRLLQERAETFPGEPPPVVRRHAAELAAAQESELRVTWLGHSTFLVELEGHRLLVDPVWSERVSPLTWAGPRRFFPPPLPLEELPALDAVVISHDHYDHLDQATLAALQGRVPRFVVPLGVGDWLEAWGVPPERIVELDWWEETRLGELRLVATPARHFSGRSAVGIGRDATLWAGWAFLGQRRRVYYSGDTGMFPGFAEIGERLGPFDLAMIETGAYNPLWADVHLGPEQALVAFQLVRGGLYLPVHWGTFDLSLHAWTEPVERLLAAAAAAGVPVVVPRPGQSIEPAAPPELVRWWPRVPGKTGAEAPVISSELDPALMQRIRAAAPAAAPAASPAAAPAAAPAPPPASTAAPAPLRQVSAGG